MVLGTPVFFVPYAHITYPTKSKMATTTTATTTISPQRIQALQNTLRTLLSPEWAERLNLDGYRSSSSSSCSLMDIGVNTQTCSDVQFYNELLRAKAAGVDHVVLTGTDYHRNQAGWRRVQEYNTLVATRTIQVNGHTEKNQRPSLSLLLPKLYFTAGIHPHTAVQATPDTWKQIEWYCRSSNSITSGAAAIAVGECGLDYDRMRSPRNVQLKVFRQMVALAARLQRPLFVHERDLNVEKGCAPLGSCHDLCAILDEYCSTPTIASTTNENDNQTTTTQNDGTTVPQPLLLHPRHICVHCFTGGLVELEAYLSRGYWIGVTGFIAMRKRGAGLRQLIANGQLPLDRILLETDAPYMRGDKDYYQPREMTKPLVELQLVKDVGSTQASAARPGVVPLVAPPSGKKNKSKNGRHKVRPYTQPADTTAVARVLAELLSSDKRNGCEPVTYEMVCQVTTRNAMHFFGIHSTKWDAKNE
jgi:TatD DNase family protein